MQIQAIKVSHALMDVNSYILAEEGSGRAVVIDPSFDVPKLLRVLADEQLYCEAILLTHGHFDHIAGVSALKQEFGAPVYIHPADAAMLRDPAENKSLDFPGLELSPIEADHLLRDVDRLELAGLSVLVLATPGHSRGSVCYLCGDYLFTGDTLFNLSIGRTDFPEGSGSQMRESLEKLSRIEKDYIVHPGHGASSSLAFEKDNNPFLGRLKWSL